MLTILSRRVALSSATVFDPMSLYNFNVANFTGYKPGCQVSSNQQITFGNTYYLSYAYNLAGALATQEVYPSGRDVRWEYDVVWKTQQGMQHRLLQ